MNQIVINLDWIQLSIALTSIVGAAWMFSRGIKSDMKQFETRMEVNDQRWSVLFSRFHDLDKDMEKFKSCEKLKVCH